MHAGVGAQGGGVEETLVALRALVGADPLVDQLMALQAAGVGEHRRALRALVGLLSCMTRSQHTVADTPELQNRYRHTPIHT